MADVNRPGLLSPRLAFALVAAGVVLRVATLGHQSFWLDESFDVWAATKHTAEVIATTRLDSNEPSLYYLVLHWFLGWTGTSEAAARLPSAISSIAGIGIVYLLGRKLWPGAAVGRTAAVLLAVAPIDVWYAQEARMHGLVGTAALLLALGLFIESWWAVPLVAAGLAGGLCLDHTMWPYAIVLMGAWAVHWWQSGRRVRRLAWTLAGITAAWFAYRPVWHEAVDVYQRLNTVHVFTNARRTLGLEGLTNVSFPIALAGLFLLCVVAAALFSWMSRPLSGRRWLDAALLCCFAGGTMFAAIPRFYGLKAVIVGGWPLMVLLAAAAFVRREESSATGRQWIVLAIGVSLCAVTITFFTPRANWRGVAAHLASTQSPRSVVVLDPGYNDLPYGYYRPDQSVIRGPVASLDNLGAKGSNINEACLIAERFGSSPPTSPSEAWMDRNLTLIRTISFSRLELRCYRVR